MMDSVRTRAARTETVVFWYRVKLISGLDLLRVDPCCKEALLEAPRTCGRQPLEGHAASVFGVAQEPATRSN